MIWPWQRRRRLAQARALIQQHVQALPDPALRIQHRCPGKLCLFCAEESEARRRAREELAA